MVTVAHEEVVAKSKGLTPGNSYTIYWIAEDHFGNVSALKQFQFRTGNRYIENFDGLNQPGRLTESARPAIRIGLTMMARRSSMASMGRRCQRRLASESGVADG